MDNLVLARVCLLPDNVLQTLRYASCLGSLLDKEILSHLVGESRSTISSQLVLTTAAGADDIIQSNGCF